MVNQYISLICLFLCGIKLQIYLTDLSNGQSFVKGLKDNSSQPGQGQDEEDLPTSISYGKILIIYC